MTRPSRSESEPVTGAHEDLVRRGLELHEERDYAGAIPFFERARQLAPDCPSAAYNVANTLHMLGRNRESVAILTAMVRADDKTLRDGCPDLAESPRSMRLDAYFLLFLVVLYDSGSWRQAVPYLRQHLAARARGLASLWSRADVLRRAEELRREFAPMARGLSGRG